MNEAWGLVLVVLGSISPVLAEEEGLVEEVERHVRLIDSSPKSVRAPDFGVSDMYRRRVALADYRGRAVVLTFLSPRCYKEAIGWLKGVQTSFLGDVQIAFVNVLFPGPTPAFASRSATLKKIRERIEDFYQEVREKMPPEERRRLERTEIRWIIDWRRELHQRYDVETDRVHIFLIDRDGGMRERFSRRTSNSERLLAETLEGLRAEPADG